MMRVPAALLVILKEVISLGFPDAFLPPLSNFKSHPGTKAPKERETNLF